MKTNNRRQVIACIEATGADPEDGHRIVELALVEMLNEVFTLKAYHSFINPERSIEEYAEAVHGISDAAVEDAPVFSEIAQEVVDFLSGAELIVHSAPFTVAFLNTELTGAGEGKIEKICTSVSDTLDMARKLRPSAKNNIDTLIQDFSIEPPKRTVHGAELDAYLIGSIFHALKKQTLH